MNKIKLNIKFLAVIFAALFVFTACDEEDDMQPTTKSIVETATSDDQFSTLVAALQKANLVSTLQGEGPFTVFAPTNDAFDALFNDLGVSGLDDLSADALKPILLYHVINGDVKSSDLTTGYFTTASTSGPNDEALSVYINVDNGVVINGSSNVTTADVEATNGVIHVINEVILPPNVVDIATTNNNFSSLVSALSTADGDLVTVLSGNGPFTVFAPTNAAFDAISNVTAGLSTSELADVLKYHVVSGANVRSTDLSDGQMVTTLNGDFTIDLSGGTAKITDGSGATVNITLTDVQGTNGVVHVIDAVLLQ